MKYSHSILLEILDSYRVLSNFLKSDSCYDPTQSETGIWSELRSEQSYQILEESNEIGLGFNLCVAPTRMICRFVLEFRNSGQRLESNRGRARVGQESEYRDSQLLDE